MRKMFSEKQIKEMILQGSIEVIESGLVDNAKSIYCHPITIYSADSCILTMFIFNQQETAFSKDELIAYLKDSNTRGRYLVNGAYYTSSYYLSPSYAYCPTTGDYANTLLLVGVDTNGNTHSTNANVINLETIITNSSFFDEVNKIN